MPDLQVAVTQASAAVFHSDMSATAGEWHIQVTESLAYRSHIDANLLLLPRRTDRLPRDGGLSLPIRPTTLKRQSFHGDKHHTASRFAGYRAVRRQPDSSAVTALG